ncbi:MAG: 4-alpha-glucanotransferase [Clostridiales bacterium]|nr:4-alpha-glucanotransferase [Clostridiales bacterium]
MRKSGILLHISSLPGKGGIGTLGKEARVFADFLQQSGMSIWQVLPMGPTGYGESPYQSSSIFAGNPMLISLETMRDEGLVQFDDSELYVPQDECRVDYDAVRANKEMLLHRAFETSEEALREEIDAYVAKTFWVHDFALFTAIKQHFGNQMWQKWPDDIRLRKKAAIARYEKELDKEIRYHAFCQYIFHCQWVSFKAYCNERGISLFGDMPIYVAEDSADTWTQPEVFQMDKNRMLTKVAGVPPDYFSADGQLWGNPLYRWKYLENRDFYWWVTRMDVMSQMYDMIRVDHFIGFANYYSIPQGAPNARCGKWILGPGKKLFTCLKEKLPHLNVVAEDLGEVNDRVRDLLKFVGYPGMKVALFGFDTDETNIHYVHNFPENCIAYTGTHDNNTVRGWYEKASPDVQHFARITFHFHNEEDVSAAFIRGVMNSNANTAILPMQDILALNDDCRMNTPGTTGSSWTWRMAPNTYSQGLVDYLRGLNIQSRRGTIG